MCTITRVQFPGSRLNFGPDCIAGYFENSGIFRKIPGYFEKSRDISGKILGKASKILNPNLH